MIKSKYLSHDYNARTDEKLVKVRMKHGWAGYGLYWAILEKLYDASGALDADYSAIAFDLMADEEVIKSIINDFNLYYVCTNTGNIRCKSADRRFEAQAERSRIGYESSMKRWAAKMGNPKPTHRLPKQDPMLNSKEKEVKENKKKSNIPEAYQEPKKSSRFAKPTISEVIAYCKERNNNINAQAFIDWNDSKGWVIGKSPMKDWKAAVRTWERHEHNQNKSDGGNYAKQGQKTKQGWD